MINKKYAIGLVCVLVLAVITFFVYSLTRPIPKLSEMEDDELLQYVIDAGVSIPKNVRIETVRLMIIQLEEDPEYDASGVGYTPLEVLFEDLRHLVKTYYSIGE